MDLLKIIVLIFIFVILYYLYKHLTEIETLKKPEYFGLDEENYALAALEQLDKAKKEAGITDVDDLYLKDNANKIEMIAGHGNKDVMYKPLEYYIELESEGSDEMTFGHPIEINYWPYYFYSAPYQYKSGGAWPPNMQSRLYNWEPGFSTGSGWSYWLRPGITYDNWPRNRWVKQNGAYYFINNGKSRENDYNGLPS